jgi:hypothetical protein
VTLLGVDFQALSAGSGQMASAAGEFTRGCGLIGGTPRAEGGTGLATELLEHLLSALSDALGKAGAELQQVSEHLSATADTYGRTEQALSGWQVPGGS